MEKGKTREKLSLFHISKILFYSKGMLLVLLCFLNIFTICMKCQILKIHQIFSYWLLTYSSHQSTGIYGPVDTSKSI